MISIQQESKHVPELLIKETIAHPKRNNGYQVINCFGNVGFTLLNQLIVLAMY